MHVLTVKNKVFISNYRKLLAYFIKNAPKKIRLLRNHYRNIWNSWANRLAEIFLLLSNEEDRK